MLPCERTAVNTFFKGTDYMFTDTALFNSSSTFSTIRI